VAWLLPDQNLKNKYNAKWALVTGASSGLGRCLADRLAAQGLNVVLAALPDNLLEETYHDLKIKYPHLEFRKVPIDFGEYTANYMEALERATNDITIQILFNNVGYCIMGAFTKTPIDQILRNIECNAISHVKVTHHFMKKMVDKKVKGAIVFTGSTSAFHPAPPTPLYAATKSFLTYFAYNLAFEAKYHGIDITVVQSGPMATRFQDNLPKLDAFKFYNFIQSTPDSVARLLINSVGRIVIRDASLYAVLARLFVHVLDLNVQFPIIYWGQFLSSDYRKFKHILY
jgi:short-subunit dehydrogenase